MFYCRLIVLLNAYRRLRRPHLSGCPSGLPLPFAGALASAKNELNGDRITCLPLPLSWFHGLQCVKKDRARFRFSATRYTHTS